jgi:hypothetical protein
MDENDDLGGKEAYKIALDTRNLEIGLFWQRSNYFLALNTALAIGFFNINDRGYTLLLALFGFAISLLWYRVNLGSKFWQSRWEHRLRVVEEEIAPDLKFFAADWETIRKDVQASLKTSAHKGFQKFVDRGILKKHSVSYQMIRLSILFVLGWAFLSATQAFQVCNMLYAHFAHQ